MPPTAAPPVVAVVVGLPPVLEIGQLFRKRTILRLLGLLGLATSYYARATIYYAQATITTI